MSLAGSSLRCAFQLSDRDFPQESFPAEPTRRFRTRRLLDHLRHFANFSSSREPHDNGAAFAYIDSMLGHQAPSNAIEELAKLSGQPSPQFTAFASLCADAFAKKNAPICLDASTIKHIWEGHLASRPGAGAGFACVNSATYAARHLALSAWFPFIELEAQSRSMVDGPTLAAIELGELRRIVPAFVPEKISDDNGPDIFNRVVTISAAPTRKIRL
jgi:hypothetical protein